MGLCDGDWKSEIMFDQQAGDATPPAYANDGTLHICPSVNTEIRGQQTVDIAQNISKTFLFQGGSCVPDGDDRFQVEYSREAPDEETYHYTGSGRVLNTGQVFIYGRVKVTSESGVPGNDREGAWEAVRLGVPGGKPGGGEDGIATPSEGTVVTVTITSTGGVTIT